MIIEVDELLSDNKVLQFGFQIWRFTDLRVSVLREEGFYLLVLLRL